MLMDDALTVHGDVAQGLALALLYLVMDFSCYPNHVPLDFRLPIRACKTGGVRPAGLCYL